GGIVLARHPRAAVHHDHLVAAVLRHDPRADDRLERGGLFAPRFLRGINFGGACGQRRRQWRPGNQAPSKGQEIQRRAFRVKTAAARTSTGQIPQYTRLAPRGGTASGWPRKTSSSFSAGGATPAIA